MRAGEFAPPHADILSAVRHHDDGWREWDAAPRIDVETGIPRSFLEMPMSVATEIWTRSIDCCGGERSAVQDTGAPAPSQSHRESIASPLGGLAVSKHFCWLADLALGTRNEKEEHAAIERFLETQARQQAAWRKTILANSRASNAEVDDAIEMGFQSVQYFDRLSLWLCCAPRSDAIELQFTGGAPFQFTPLTPYRIAIEPFPLSTSGGSPGGGLSLEVSVSAKRIAARRYADDDDLLNALHDSKAERLTWTLSSV